MLFRSRLCPGRSNFCRITDSCRNKSVTFPSIKRRFSQPPTPQDTTLKERLFLIGSVGGILGMISASGGNSPKENLACELHLNILKIRRTLSGILPFTSIDDTESIALAKRAAENNDSFRLWQIISEITIDRRPEAVKQICEHILKGIIATRKDEISDDKINLIYESIILLDKNSMDKIIHSLSESLYEIGFHESGFQLLRYITGDSRQEAQTAYLEKALSLGKITIKEIVERQSVLQNRIQILEKEDEKTANQPFIIRMLSGYPSTGKYRLKDENDTLLKTIVKEKQKNTEVLDRVISILQTVQPSKEVSSLQEKILQIADTVFHTETSEKAGREIALRSAREIFTELNSKINYTFSEDEPKLEKIKELLRSLSPEDVHILTGRYPIEYPDKNRENSLPSLQKLCSVITCLDSKHNFSF